MGYFGDDEEAELVIDALKKKWCRDSEMQTASW